MRLRIDLVVISKSIGLTASVFLIAVYPAFSGIIGGDANGTIGGDTTGINGLVVTGSVWCPPCNMDPDIFQEANGIINGDAQEA